jgi:hypothetical protein
MKLCPKCVSSPLPFFMVFFVAGVSAFLTWLTLTFSQAGMTERVVGTVVVFLAVGGTVLHYVLSCMRRHCRHGQEAHQGKGAAN